MHTRGLGPFSGIRNKEHDMAEYYIEVGKRKTKIKLASVTRCFEIGRMLEQRLGRRVDLGTPMLVTNEVYETEPLNRAYRAVKILDLIL